MHTIAPAAMMVYSEMCASEYGAIPEADVKTILDWAISEGFELASKPFSEAMVLFARVFRADKATQCPRIKGAILDIARQRRVTP